MSPVKTANSNAEKKEKVKKVVEPVERRSEKPRAAKKVKDPVPQEEMAKKPSRAKTIKTGIKPLDVEAGPSVNNERTKKGPSKKKVTTRNGEEAEEETKRATKTIKKKAKPEKAEEKTAVEVDEERDERTKKGPSKKKVTTRNGEEAEEETKRATKTIEKKAKPEKAEEKTAVEVDEEDLEDKMSKVTRRIKRKKVEDDVEVPQKKATLTKEVTKGQEKEAKPTETARSKLMNSTDTNWAQENFMCAQLNAKGNSATILITSWNVAGLNAWMKKGGLDILKHAKPKILCLQETKMSELVPEMYQLGYNAFNCGSEKPGYAGVVILTKQTPIDAIYGIRNEELDDGGRCITLEFEKFYLVNVYVPNAGRKLVTLPKRLKWNTAFKSFVKELDKKKPVILCGDFNVAHEEIDLANPKTNRKHAGFTPEERQGMTDLLSDGYVDTFRHFHPDKVGAYTFWTYMGGARKKNIGWRLDYFLTSKRLLKNLCDQVIHEKVLGSDHCPLTLYFDI